jgi:hypothetical protein
MSRDESLLEASDASSAAETKKVRVAFDHFRSLNPYPTGLETPEHRKSAARIGVILADFRNKITSIGWDVDLDLYHDIAGDHDRIAIPLYLRLYDMPDRDVMDWAEGFAKKYQASNPDVALDDETDFVMITCRSFYDPAATMDPDDMDLEE